MHGGISAVFSFLNPQALQRVLRFLLHLFLTLWLGLLVAAAIQCHRKPVWVTLQQGAGKAPSPNLLDILEQSVFRKNATLELSEPDVNAYLATVIAGRQEGLSSDHVRFKSVALDFEPGICKICLSWELFGQVESTADLEFTLQRVGDQFFIEPVKGHYGRLPLYRGMMGTLLPAIEKLGTALNDEARLLFQMNQISFAKDKMILDPRMTTAR